MPTIYTKEKYSGVNSSVAYRLRLDYTQNILANTSTFTPTLQVYVSQNAYNAMSTTHNSSSTSVTVKIGSTTVTGSVPSFSIAKYSTSAAIVITPDVWYDLSTLSSVTITHDTTGYCPSFRTYITWNSGTGGMGNPVNVDTDKDSNDNDLGSAVEVILATSSFGTIANFNFEDTITFSVEKHATSATDYIDMIVDGEVVASTVVLPEEETATFFLTSTQLAETYSYIANNTKTVIVTFAMTTKFGSTTVGTVYATALGTINGTYHFKIGSTYKTGVIWANVGGVWYRCVANENIEGIWY